MTRTVLVSFGEKIATVLLIDTVCAMWIRSARTVELNNAQEFVIATLVEGGGPTA